MSTPHMLPDDAPWPGSTVWYATGLGWRVAEGGTLGSGWNRGDPDGDGTPSTAAEEQVWVPPHPPKKNNEPISLHAPPFSVGASYAAPGRVATSPAPTARVESAGGASTLHRQRRLAERISWLEYELANPPTGAAPYAVWLGPDPDYGRGVAVHIPVVVVQERIRVALASMRRELDALQRRD